jgi:hypothetical protein
MKSCDSDDKWRPSNHSAEEQVCPRIVAVLRRKKTFLEKQLKFQEGKIQELVMQVEQNRQILRNQLIRTEQILDEIQQDKLKIEKVEEQNVMISQLLNSK